MPYPPPLAAHRRMGHVHGHATNSRSDVRVLLNAEPFGYGPTSAIASFFPGLRSQFAHLAYLGKGHSLDLQKNLPYDAVYDWDALSAEQTRSILSRYDVFFTALDFGAAEQALSCGLSVAIYDPLTWFWKTIPDVVRHSAAYLAQNFFGVEERLDAERSRFPASVQVMPPFLTPRKRHPDARHVLLNFGGLQNPLCSTIDLARYARSLIRAVRACVPDPGDLIMASSQAIAALVPDEPIRCYERAEMRDILHHTRYALMTPGLGNIYDAAEYDLPTVWLPPTNDGQGQQLDILVRRHLVDAHADWSCFAEPVDYGADQPLVFDHIRNRIHALSSDRNLHDVLRMGIDRACRQDSSVTTRLIERFGTLPEDSLKDILSSHIVQAANVS